jgi:hypothetical protein
MESSGRQHGRGPEIEPTPGGPPDQEARAQSEEPQSDPGTYGDAGCSPLCDTTRGQVAGKTSLMFIAAADRLWGRSARSTHYSNREAPRCAVLVGVCFLLAAAETRVCSSHESGGCSSRSH